ncbi:hypothetical protein FNV43_RR25793 [Rhamnella rubrinervis]|uniref:Uncharacterized protein n=1 Tax=Rhamnella rubrinervis TaxID=2594499 RepID=A0A8K0DLF1_9ROSA|nr:hypothetical protein FNV43_RR25793 [Rhamnella rubrinervis]
MLPAISPSVSSPMSLIFQLAAGLIYRIPLEISHGYNSVASIRFFLCYAPIQCAFELGAMVDHVEWGRMSFNSETVGQLIGLLKIRGKGICLCLWYEGAEWWALGSTVWEVYSFSQLGPISQCSKMNLYSKTLRVENYSKQCENDPKNKKEQGEAVLAERLAAITRQLKGSGTELSRRIQNLFTLSSVQANSVGAVALHLPGSTKIHEQSHGYARDKSCD